MRTRNSIEVVNSDINKHKDLILDFSSSCSYSVKFTGKIIPDVFNMKYIKVLSSEYNVDISSFVKNKLHIKQGLSYDEASYHHDLFLNKGIHTIIRPE